MLFFNINKINIVIFFGYNAYCIFIDCLVPNDSMGSTLKNVFVDILIVSSEHIKELGINYY